MGRIRPRSVPVSSGDAQRCRRDLQPVRPRPGGRRPLPTLGRPRLLHRRRGQRQDAVQPGHPAAERDRLAAPRARARADDDGRAAAPPSHAGPRGAVAARHGPRRHRDPGARREAPRRDRGQVPARHRPRGVRRAGVGVEGRIRRQDPRPDAAPRSRCRLVARALHDGRRPLDSRCRPSSSGSTKTA